MTNGMTMTNAVIECILIKKRAAGPATRPSSDNRIQLLWRRSDALFLLPSDGIC